MYVAAGEKQVRSKSQFALYCFSHQPSQSCQTAPEPEKPIRSKKVVKSSQGEKMLKTCSVPGESKQSGRTGEAKPKTKGSVSSLMCVVADLFS